MQSTITRVYIFRLARHDFRSNIGRHIAESSARNTRQSGRSHLYQSGRSTVDSTTGRRFTTSMQYLNRDFSPHDKMGKPKVLLFGTIDHEDAQKSWNDLSKLADIIEPKAKNREEFLKEAKSGAFEGVVAAYRTFNSVEITGRWDEELVNALPKSFVFVAHNGAGYDQIDVAACSARSPPLRVSNCPTAVDDATADVGIFLTLGALRGLNTSMLALREGKWRGNPAPPLGHDPEGKTLGVLGMGGIGRNMAKKLAAFGMKTIYHNRKPLSTELAAGAEYVSFDELLARSDVLSLNLPLNNHTRHIISTAEFAKMKKGIVIVNTARGAVIDEAALVKALDDGQVGSVGLDVFEEEPKIHPGLLKNPNVMLVPHMGTWTKETQTAMEQWTIDNVRSALETGKLKSPVPDQADL